MAVPDQSTSCWAEVGKVVVRRGSRTEVDRMAMDRRKGIGRTVVLVVAQDQVGCRHLEDRRHAYGICIVFP